MKHANDNYEYVGVRGHEVPFYNGRYYRQGYWNAKPHFVKADGSSHLFHFRASFDGTGYWHLDPTDQWGSVRPGDSDLYEGGYFFSETDFDYSQDFQGSAYLEMYYITLRLSIQMSNTYVEIAESDAAPPPVPVSEVCTYTDGEY